MTPLPGLLVEFNSYNERTLHLIVSVEEHVVRTFYEDGFGFFPIGLFEAQVKNRTITYV